MATKAFLQALRGETLDRPPFWLMRQAGRYLPEYRETRTRAKNFLEFCYTPDLAVEVTLQPLARYRMDAAILFCDILVIPDALGRKVEFQEGLGPVLEPLRTAEGLERLDPGRITSHLAPVFETVRRLAGEIPKETALIGFAGAPWTVAVYMVEGKGGTQCQRTKGWAYRAPDEFARLMDILVDATVDYLKAQIDAGAEANQIFDSWAGVLSEPEFRRWSIDPTTRIVETLHKAHPDVPVIGFPRGAGVLYEDFVRETKVDGVSRDSNIPLEWAAERLQPHCTVQGILDNQLLVAGGDAMVDEARRILGILNNGPFVFNLGHGIVPETPPENVARLAELLHGWPKESG